MALLALVVRQHGVTTTVIIASKHHSFCAKTAVHADVLCLALDKGDHVAAQKHLHLGIPILEKLVLSDLRLVTEQVDLKSSSKLVKMNMVVVESLSYNLQECTSQI